MGLEKNYTHNIIEVCMLAGKIMLQSGAETYRVEDTMTRIAEHFGCRESHSYVTPTAIVFSIESGEMNKTKLVRISERTTDLKKVSQVNSVSRKISSGLLSLGEAYSVLEKIEKSEATYSIFAQVLAASIASGCFVIMFKGTWYDVLPAFFAGGIGLWIYIMLQRFIPIKFFSEFAASFMIGVVSYLFVLSGIGLELDKIIIGSVMPLVPGLVLTNAIRDLMAGHLVAGISKGAEALLTAFAIGSGIAVILFFTR